MLFELDGEAFLQIAREHACRFKALQNAEHGFYFGQACTQQVGHRFQLARQIARFIDHADQMRADEAAGGVGNGQMELVGQVFVESYLARHILRVVHVITAAVGVARMAAHAGPATIGASSGLAVGGISLGFIGIDIGEVGIHRLQSLGGACLAFEFGGHVGGLAGSFGGDERLFVPVEQRIALKLGFDKGLQFKIRHLQQFDCLLQLRCHDQGLALTHFQFLRKPHSG